MPWDVLSIPFLEIVKPCIKTGKRKHLAETAHRASHSVEPFLPFFLQLPRRTKKAKDQKICIMEESNLWIFP